MIQGTSTVCLCMIVKNERHVIRRCLESARPFIDTFAIVDTGSTDGTQDLIREVYHDLPGEVFDRPWKNFGHNRTEALALARPRADYLLTLDADEVFQAEPDFRWPALTADAYFFMVRYGEIDYRRIQLVRSALPWRYEGVLHEYITVDENHTQQDMPGIRTVVSADGARSGDPLKFRRDALVLEQAILDEPENPRHMFYLAQSYRDCGERAAAIDRYRRRVLMGGWDEEAWYALYEIARIQQADEVSWPVVLESALRAVAFRPTRAEPLFLIGMHYQRGKDFTFSRMFFGQAMQVPFPADDRLFVEVDMYRYTLPLEYAVACYWLGLHDEAIHITDRLLADSSLSADRRELLQRNRGYSMQALHRTQVPARNGLTLI